MSSWLTRARYGAVLYAAVVGLLQLSTVISLAVNAPEQWRKVVGHTVVGIVAALLPLVALTIGRRFAEREKSQYILAIGVIAACILPLVWAGMLMFSVEPLAMLALLYVPPAQLLLLIGVVAAAAFANRAKT